MKAVILMCALSLSWMDCSVDTAADVIRGPEANTLAQCSYLGHAHPASAELAVYLDGGNYLKILCDGEDLSSSPMRAAISKTQVTGARPR